jgi:hypothetical protein
VKTAKPSSFVLKKLPTFRKDFAALLPTGAGSGMCPSNWILSPTGVPIGGVTSCTLEQRKQKQIRSFYS